MDHLNRYRAAVREVLSHYAGLENQGPPARGVQTFCAFTQADDQYLVVRLGWTGQRRVKGVILHHRIHGSKVGLEENGTDCQIASKLAALGVPPDRPDRRSPRTNGGRRPSVSPRGMVGRRMPQLLACPCVKCFSPETRPQLGEQMN